MAITMTNYAPFDSGPGSSLTESGWRAMMQYQVQTGVLRNIDNELTPYGDSTGMQVKVMSGQCLIMGHWGQTTSETVLPITTANATNPRRDLVVARVDFVNNRIELDVVTGTAAATPVVPDLTRNTSVWEIPLAVVQVDAAVATIAAAKVFDIRQWGGPMVNAAADDFQLFQDRVSSCSRNAVNGTASCTNGFVYVNRMQSPLDQAVSKIKFFLTTARVAGTPECKIFYKGWRSDMFYNSITPTITNFGLTAGAIVTGTFTPITLRAGEQVLVAIRFTSTTTAPVFAALDVSSGIGVNANALLNEGSTTHMTCAFKNTTMPTTPFNLLDGTWSTRDRYFWCALS